MGLDPTTRFGDRVSDYVKYRPAYPPEIITFLRQEIGLTEDHEVADIGSGPGNCAKLFVTHGNFVYGIEPNQDMFSALIEQMKPYPNFSARLAAAEKTSLDDQSVNVIACGQSFHWFDLKKTKSEFERILADDGWIVLVWNTRKRDTEFGKSYEDLLRTYGTDYQNVDHSITTTEKEFDYLYGSHHWKKKAFGNVQVFDFESLKGRLTSSSYAPKSDHPNFEPMITELEKLFNKHEKNGLIEFEYETEVIYGQL